MKRFVMLPGLLALLLFAVRAAAQDDDYVQVYSLIQAGDALNSSSQPPQALAKYREAQAALLQFQRVYPDWNRKIVDFRLNYLAARIAELTKSTPAPPASPLNWPKPNTPAPAGLPPAERGDLESRIASLQNRVRQLESDNGSLEAKLREALSARPAALDPRELAKAEERIRSLEKENALLQVNHAQPAPSAAPAEEARAIAQLKGDLAEANGRLAEQARRADTLAEEKKVLQTRLDSLIPAAWNSNNIAATLKALDEAKDSLARQTDLATTLARDKEKLLARVKALETDAGTVAALRAENEILKKQLASSKTAGKPGPDQEAARQLMEARVRIAVLESENAMLEKQARTPAPPASVQAPAPAGESPRLKELRRERDDLRKRLDAANKELNGRKSRAAASRIEDLTGQLDVLRSRLAVFEAQKVPFTEGELALFKAANASLVVTDPHAGQKPSRDLPSGTAALASEAQRLFAAKQFDKAESVYRQILKKDEKNVYTLANLATIQLELSHLDEAESHVRRALALQPEDAYSLSVLGQIEFRRGKYDESLNALSRAVKIDPQSAEIQNYLGLALSQKGMRGAAETAFRRAIQIDPNCAAAHHNLAVFYISQKPAWPELARWHYKKALEAGFPRNPDLEKLLGEGK